MCVRIVDVGCEGDGFSAMPTMTLSVRLVAEQTPPDPGSHVSGGLLKAGTDRRVASLLRHCMTGSLLVKDSIKTTEWRSRCNRCCFVFLCLFLSSCSVNWVCFQWVTCPSTSSLHLRRRGFLFTPHNTDPSHRAIYPSTVRSVGGGLYWAHLRHRDLTWISLPTYYYHLQAFKFLYVFITLARSWTDTNPVVTCCKSVPYHVGAGAGRQGHWLRRLRLSGVARGLCGCGTTAVVWSQQLWAVWWKNEPKEL